jgi:sulfate permease, SulP family
VSSPPGPRSASGFAAWVPAASWLPRYDRTWLRPDTIAAVTVWAVVVPQAIAYAQIAGVPPGTGLFAAAAGLVGYGLLGTSKQIIVSPTSSTAAISASIVGAVAAGAVDRFGVLSAALAMLAGIALIIMGWARLGFVARFIPHAVHVGFMFGLGLTIIVGQAAKILGVPGTSGTFGEQLGQITASVAATGVNLLAIVIGVGALAALLIARRVAPTLPMAIVVVAVGIVAVAAFGLADRGVAVVGPVEGGWPLPALPLVGARELLVLVPGAIAISIVGYAESLSVAQQLADEHGDEIRPDQELVASGGANALAGLFGGFVVGGGASQSAANNAAGGQTQFVSFIVAGLTILTSVALLPLFADLPQPVLGAIVITGVVGFLRVVEIRRIRSLRRDAFVGTLVALVATLVLGILPGLIASVILALLILLVRIAKPKMSAMGHLTDRRNWVALERAPEARTEPGLLVLRLDAPLLFLNAGLMRDELRSALAATDPPPTVVILDLSMSSDLDIESLDTLIRLAEHASQVGAELWLAEVRGPVRDMFEGAGVDPVIGQPRLFRSMLDAMAAFDARSHEGAVPTKPEEPTT